MQGGPHFDPATVVQYRPWHVGPVSRREMHGIQQIVPSHQQQAERDQHTPRQPHQQRERQHAQPDDPDHLQVDHAGRELERPGEVHQGDFQHDEKQPALEQEA